MHLYQNDQQLRLFDNANSRAEASSDSPPQNPEVEARIREFLSLWKADESPSKRSIERTRSSLRSLARRSKKIGGPNTPLELARRPDVVACIARAPGRVRDATVSTWLQAMRDFIRIMIAPPDAAKRLIEEIDALLIPRSKPTWQFSDTTGGGHPQGGRDRLLLVWVDLMAVIERASQGKAGELAFRDRTILGMCCGSSLRISEIADLRWQDLRWHPEGEHKLFPVWATTERRGGPVQLPVYFRVVPSLLALRDIQGGADGASPSGSIFRELRNPFSGLKRRRVKSIFDEAVGIAGFPGASLLELKAAFADHLIHKEKISEEHLTRLLGYARHESTLDLLREHKIWRLNQERIRIAAEREAP